MSGDFRVDVCVIGHVTRDLVRDETGSVRAQSGGAAYYGAAALARLGLHVRLVTRLAVGDEDLLSELRDLGVAIETKPSAATTVFEAVQTPRSPHRSYRAISVADPFEPGDFAGVAARAAMMDPLTRHENFADLLAAAAVAAPIVALDVQGFVRKFLIPGVPEAMVRAARKGFSNLTIVKADAAEAEAITGESEPAAAARALADLGPGEVIVTSGGEGSLVCAGNAVTEIPAFCADPLVDPTGAGDSYLAGYLAARLEGQEPRNAARFGAAVASLKLSRAGAFTASRGDVAAMLVAHRG